jgi:phosphatidylinositol kinase/protein kinase (PI-3  family)
MSSKSHVGSFIMPSPMFKELTTDTLTIEILRKWAEVNISLLKKSGEIGREGSYIANAIGALSECARLSPTFPDIVRLLNVFFENAGKCPDEICNSLRSLPPKFLLQAHPQLLVRLDHTKDGVSKVVFEILFELLRIHYHDLIFGVIVLVKSKNEIRARAAKDLLERFGQIAPIAFAEVRLIRRSLLRIAVTWCEKVFELMESAYIHEKVGRSTEVMRILGSILAMVDKQRKCSCQMHDQFRSQFSAELSQLRNIMDVAPDSKEIHSWCKKMYRKCGVEKERIRIIQLSAISKELCEKSGFLIAVPGTYRPCKPIIHVDYFIGQCYVLKSNSNPKDICMKGRDSGIYEYLLKGHEDLRLDE